MADLIRDKYNQRERLKKALLEKISKEKLEEE